MARHRSAKLNRNGGGYTSCLGRAGGSGSLSTCSCLDEVGDEMLQSPVRREVGCSHRLASLRAGGMLRQPGDNGGALVRVAIDADDGINHDLLRDGAEIL